MVVQELLDSVSPAMLRWMLSRLRYVICGARAYITDPSCSGRREVLAESGIVKVVWPEEEHDRTGLLTW